MKQLQVLIDKIKTYKFECEGGALENCEEFITLQKLINDAQQGLKNSIVLRSDRASSFPPDTKVVPLKLLTEIL